MRGATLRRVLGTVLIGLSVVTIALYGVQSARPPELAANGLTATLETTPWPWTPWVGFVGGGVLLIAGVVLVLSAERRQ